MPAFQSHRYVENQGVKLCLETRGSGRIPLLFVHGWISSRRMWYEVANRLDPERCTMHLLDLRGAGLSDRPPHGQHVYGYLSDVFAAIDAIGSPVNLVAHSMGGRIAQLAAVESPGRISRMVLLAPGAAGGPKASKRRAQLAQHAFGSRERIEAFQRAAMSIAVDPDVMERLVDDALVAQREVWFGDPEPREPVDFTDRLGEIKAPVLCLAGAKDPLAPPLRVKGDVAARIPGALMVTLRNAGHNLPVEAAGDVASGIERFLL
ncbi:MAG TPA: alpha/beta hydrolase [Candidatus Baltobacteraceae bacterium]|nr:alpha/beta hydrolase [Candidatus Baltobacteraceae bacterium]